MYINKPFDQAADHFLSPAEKRQLERHHLLYYLRIWDADKNCLLGHLADVSTEGFLLVGEDKLPTNQVYNIEMKLPSNHAEKNEPESLSFKAETCWSSNDVNNQFYDTGFKFQDISADLVEKILAVIQDYGFNSQPVDDDN